MTRFPFAFVATLSALSAGCSESPSVPKVDISAAGGYAVAPFRDDAPANARPDGDTFPRSFVDRFGNPVDLTKYKGKKKVVLVVLRGMPLSTPNEFCPSCLAQVGSLLANQSEFTDRGVEVLVVFPGPAERLGEFLQIAKTRTPGEPEVRFPVLLDRDCAACDRLGIRADLAKPSTYVLNTKGEVVYAYVGETSTDRPSVRAVLAQLDKAD
ncbi:MAG TPA: redoxin domain-containing protein [Fimbriiglobus sp.]|jgi:peroxiredoxin